MNLTSDADITKVAGKLKKNYIEDVKKDNGLFDALDGEHFKTVDGVEYVNLFPSNNAMEITGDYIFNNDEYEKQWYKVEDVKKMKQHPVTYKQTSVRVTANQKLENVQAKLSESERFQQKATQTNYNSIANSLQEGVKEKEDLLIKKYGLDDEGKIKINDPNDPDFIAYQNDYKLLTDITEEFKGKDSGFKLAALYEKNKEARTHALDKDIRRLNQTGRWLHSTGKW
jgi:hypothetical protein